MDETLSQRVDRLRNAKARSRGNTLFFYQLTQAISWIASLRIWRILRWPLVFAFRKYRWLWMYCVYRREGSSLKFSKSRAGVMLLSTAAFIWFAAIPIIGFTYDVFLYALTAQHDETLYLFGSQEIDANTNMHNVEGVEHLPWSDEDAIYFRTENTEFNNVWSILHGKGLFFPEYVAAAVPYAVTKCTVTSYGIRFRFMMRYINVYPKLLSVKCHGGST